MRRLSSWLVISVIIFGCVELFQWAKGAMLPLPIYVLGGALLAIASNYEKGLGLLFNQSSHAKGNLSPGDE